MKQAVALLEPASVWRLRLAAVLLSVAALAMMGRLFDLHVFDRDFYQRHGDARAIRTETIEAHRGMIIDRNGHPLAVSTPLESICANPKSVLAAAERIPELARALEIDPKELIAKLQAGAAARREFLYLRRQLPPDLASAILDLKVPGIYGRTEYRRYYPDGEVTAHVLGFTNVDDHGQEGVELAFDGHLRGQDGRRKVLQDRRAEPIRELSRIRDPRPGGELRLSLDARIQALAYRELKAAVQENGAAGGSVVMLDSTTGDVLAMVNQPSFNPNNRIGLQPHNLRNRAIIDLVEPGSTVKPFTLAVALASGRYQPSTVIDTTPGYIQINGKVIRDVHNYGVIDLSHVLSKSSNVGTIKVALTLEETAVRDLFDQVGLGRSTGSGFPGEAVGSLPSGSMRHPLVRATLSFGYGLAVTPLQLAEAYSVLANDGVRRGIKILADSAVDPGVRVIDSQVNRQIVAMLEQVVTPGGTGFKARVPGYRVAGKTGTVHKIGTGGYEASNYLSVFAGFAPVEQPRVVAVIIIDNPTAGAYYGGAVAAPVFGKVMTGTLRLLDVPPEGGKGLQVAKGWHAMMQQQTGSAAMSLATLLAMPGMAGGELPVTGLALDSRQVRPGDLFLAVPGLHGDGRRHIDAALAAGAAAVLCEAEGFDPPTATTAPVVAIVALRQRLGELADRFNHAPSTQLRVTGVTGTNGKSSVCHELAQLLGSQGDNCAVIGTLGNGFLGQLSPTRHTTPDVVQLHGLLARLLAQGADSVAVEVSSHALDQGRVDGVRFHEAVFTNLSHDHLDYHGDMQRYGAAKARLFVWPGLQRVVINLDDPFGRELLKRVPEGVEALSCSLERPEADLHAEIRSIAQGELRAWLTTPWGRGELVTTLLGRFNLANLLAALAVAAGRGFEFSALLAACRAVRPVEGRMERLGGAGRPTVVIDYAHTPAALQSVLEALREHCDGALWCLFGCGGDRDRDKRPLMGAIAVRLADRVMVTDDNPRSESPVAITDQILSGVGAAEVLVEHERSRAIEQVIGQAAAEDWILVAGKGHERYQEVAGQRHPCNDHAIVEAALQRYRVA